MRNQALVVLSLGAALAACAPNKVSVAELARPEVIVDSIPSGARVSDNGVEIGSTPLVLRAGSGQAAAHALLFAQPGFHPEKMTIPEEEIAANNGQRVLVPLRPDLFAEISKSIAPDDLGQLTRAGSVLSRANRCPEALLYFKQALLVDARLAAAHKGLGICYAKLNRRREALESYKAYLLNAPDAPDAAKVQAMISRAEGDIDIPPPSKDD